MQWTIQASAFYITIVQAPKLISLLPDGKSICSPTQSKSCNAVNVTNTNFEILSLQVHVDVKNVGNRDGSHVLFLFSTPPSNNLDAPKKQLIGFQKVNVQAGATVRVLFNLDVCKDLSIADKTGTRMLPVGFHILYIGDLQHSVSLQISSWFALKGNLAPWFCKEQGSPENDSLAKIIDCISCCNIVFNNNWHIPALLYHSCMIF